MSDKNTSSSTKNQTGINDVKQFLKIVAIIATAVGGILDAIAKSKVR